MKEDLKKIADVLRQRLNAIKKRGYTEERLDAAIDALDELNHKLDGDVSKSSMELDVGELTDDGTADGD